MKKKIIIVGLLSISLLSLSACNSKQSETKGKETKTEQKETVKDSVDFLVGQWKMEDKGKQSESTIDFGALNGGTGKMSKDGGESICDYTPNDFIGKDGYRHVKLETETGANTELIYKVINKDKVYMGIYGETSDVKPEMVTCTRQ